VTAKTFTGTINTGITLATGVVSENYNPIYTTGLVTNSAAGSYGVHGNSGFAWSVNNSGTISGGAGGVRLQSGGSVTNGASVGAGGSIVTTALIQGFFYGQAVVAQNPGPDWHVIGAADVDGDGKADIVWQNTDGQAAVWLMNGTTVTQQSVIGPSPGASWHLFAG
jgi:hypothetical protein